MGPEIITLTVSEFLSAYGYYGLFIGSFLSALFIPMGADILFVGMLAAGINPWVCLLTATTGNWLGGLVIYYIGRSGNKEKIKRWFHIKEERLERQKVKIDKYGSLLALIVWIPVIGDVANVALGFYHTKPPVTLFLMFFGRMIRFLLWIILYFIYANRFVNFINKF